MTDDEFADLLPRGGGGRRTTRAGPSSSAATPGTCTAATTTRPPTRGWPRCWPSATSGCGTAGNRVFYFATPPRLFGPIAVSLGKAGLSVPGRRRVRPGGHREAVRLGRGQRPGPVRGPLDGVRGGADLPHRPLPGQGDGAEPAGAAVRQLDLRADLEPHLGGQRADHRRRDPRRRRTRRVLRDDGRDARHRAEPRPAGAVAVPHGAAHVLPPGGDPRREGQAAARHPAAGRRGRDRRPRRPRAVHPRRHPRATSCPATGRSRASTR